MLDLRPVFFVNGLILSVLALAMILPALVDLGDGSPDWQVFAATSALTLFVGISLILTTRSNWREMGLRQAFLMTTMIWLVIAIFGALPFTFTSVGLSYTDAFFESMSGITTTGATVLSGLDETSRGILIWRALLQWLGGIGIIVTAISILPMLRVGGMQLFRIEAFDTDKVLPRAAQIAGEILLIYMGFTLLAALIYWFLGMTGFDAIAHAFTSIATGGYSTHDDSIGHYDSAALDYAVSGVMVMGSIPFVLYVRAMHGNLSALLHDSQIRAMLGIMAISILSLAAYLFLESGLAPFEALRFTTFNAISIMTGTGYATAAFDLWGGFALAVFFLLMFIGGCAGSTSCGIKVFRFQILYATARTQLKRLMQPNGIFIARYNGQPITEQVSLSVMSFFFLYIASFAVLAAVLGWTGLDFITSLSGAATAISNVGPGLGETIGPATTFASLPDAAKWMLSAGMILGRLELFTVLILFTPHFWRG